MSDTLHVERVIEEQNGTDELAMAIMMLSMPRPVEQFDTLAVLPGLGEYWRLRHVVHDWERLPQARNLLVAGTNGNERTQQQPDLDVLQSGLVGLKRVEGVRTQVAAEHTKEQADWMVRRTDELNVQTMGLYVSPYHIVRAYLTILAAYRRAGVDPPVMIPMPVQVPPSAAIPETNEPAWGMVAGEHRRINLYQGVGDVATLPELQQYINWLWEQPVLKNASFLEPEA